MKRGTWNDGGKTVVTFDGLTLEEIDLLTSGAFFIDVVKALRQRTGLDLAGAKRVADNFVVANCLPRTPHMPIALTDAALEELTKP